MPAYAYVCMCVCDHECVSVCDQVGNTEKSIKQA